MRVCMVKLHREYRFENEIVEVVKRINNNYTERWYQGWGTKHQKIKHFKEKTFLLNNGDIVFAKELTLLNQ